jgi:hypothetical protein
VKFPLPVNQVAKFEKMNPNISVNVYDYDEDEQDLIPKHITKCGKRENHIDLLLLSSKTNDYFHYVWIKKMSALVQSRTKHKGKVFVFPHCIHPFSQQQSFENHLPDCARHVYQVAKYPSSESNEHIVKWRAREKTERVPFVIYADFESCLVPVDGDADVLAEHIPSGFCAYTVSWDEEHETDPIVYSGSNCMDVFYDHLAAEHWRIMSILKNKYEMELLNDNDREHFDRATECPRCFQPFTSDRKSCTTTIELENL